MQLHLLARMQLENAAGTVDDSPVVHTGLQGSVRDKDHKFGDSIVVLITAYAMSCVAIQFLNADQIL